MTIDIDQRLYELQQEYHRLPRWRWIRREAILAEISRLHFARDYARAKHALRRMTEDAERR